MANKYLNLGAVMEFNEEGKDNYPFISLDSSELKDFVEYLTDFGTKYLKGLDKEQIRKATKAKDIPRINISLYRPSEKAPDFIKYNLAIKLDE